MRYRTLTVRFYSRAQNNNSTKKRDFLKRGFTLQSVLNQKKCVVRQKKEKKRNNTLAFVLEAPKGERKQQHENCSVLLFP